MEPRRAAVRDVTRLPQHPKLICPFISDNGDISDVSSEYIIYSTYLNEFKFWLRQELRESLEQSILLFVGKRALRAESNQCIYIRVIQLEP